MMRRRSTLLAVGSVVAGGVGIACCAPTEVTVDLSTDQPCLDTAGTADSGVPARPIRTTVRVGATVAESQIVADTTACTQGAGIAEIGSLVIVPSGARDARFIVQAVMTIDGSDTGACLPNAANKLPSQCIVARRSYAFARHEAGTLPIRLYAACRGVSCGDTETCSIGGACVSVDHPPPECTGISCPGPVDAGIDTNAAADVAELDAPHADALAPTCRGPLNDNTLLANEPVTDQLAGNSTHLFWAAQAAATGLYNIRSVPKAGGPREEISLNLRDPIMAIAADDGNLWVGTTTGLTRWDLATKTPVTALSGHSILAISIVNGAMGTPLVYFTAILGGGAGFSELSVVDSPTSVPRVIGTIGGNQLAATSTRAYLVQNGGLYRQTLPTPGTTPNPISVAGEVAIAAFDGAAFLSFAAPNSAVTRLDDTSSTPNTLVGATNPGLLVADATNVYFLDHKASATSPLESVARVPKAGGAASPVAKGFASVSGLVVDDACVYFGATGATPGLLVYPK